MNKKGIFLGILTLICIIICLVIFWFLKKNDLENNIPILSVISKEEKTENIDVENNEDNVVIISDGKDNKVDIIDINSKTRPYAVSINNTPVAVKVQTGLNKAYLVYEIPTEGNTSRLLALYKDINEDLVIGTIRSARHNFIDYVLESDAIFVHYGWSHYAQDEERKGIVYYINGLFDKPFWRNNPEKLAKEHTAYTSIGKLKETINEKKFKTESDNTILLNYNTEDTDLSEKDGNIIANKVTIPYGAKPNITTFIYDTNTKMYNRQENGINCIDYNTKEQVNTKNIIIQKVNYSVCSDKYYWDLKTVGSGEGYFITNGYAVPITWKKNTRAGKTKYYYKDGTEIEVSDGRTYIELQTTKQKTTIE